MDKQRERMFTIEQARNLSGLTQAQMAVKLGMSEKTYIQYEKYRKIFRMHIAARFVEIVEMDMGVIIFFDDELQKICS
jgi:DNA-binding XRE family transcriptional regulator